MDTILKKIKGFEMLMLSIVLLFTTFVICWNFIFIPQLERRDELLLEIDNIEGQYDLQEENKQKADEMESLIETSKKKISLIRMQYPPIMQYEEVLFLFKDFLSTTPFSVMGCNFSLYHQINAPSISSESLLRNLDNEDALKRATELGFINADTNPQFQDITVLDGSSYETRFSFTITGTMDEIKEFLVKVEEYEPKIALTSFSLSANSDGTVSAPISISFLGIMDKHVTDYSMLDAGYWEQTEVSGKENLFALDGGDGTESQVSDMDKKILDYSYNNADFTMRLLNYTDGTTPPTVYLAATSVKDTSQKLSQIYGNNEGYEEVEIYVEEQDGRYFAKFKTNKESYPDSSYSGTAEFVPKGDDLLLYIISTPRVSADDNAGVIVKVNNNTSKDFVINIKDDDRENSRVKIVKTKPAVTVYVTN